MLSVNLGSVKYHFLSLWYYLTWDWTSVSQTIGEHYTHNKMSKEDELGMILFQNI